MQYHFINGPPKAMNMYDETDSFGLTCHKKKMMLVKDASLNIYVSAKKVQFKNGYIKCHRLSNLCRQQWQHMCSKHSINNSSEVGISGTTYFWKSGCITI